MPNTSSKSPSRRLRAIPFPLQAKEKEGPDSGGDGSSGGSSGDLLEHGFVFLNGVIDEQLSQEVVEDLLTINTLPTHMLPDHVTMFITSPGGSVYHTIRVINVMRTMRIPVATVVMGEAASGATLALMNGERGMRMAMPDAVIMSHQFATGNMGKQHELLAANVELDIVDKVLIEHYRRCTRKSERYIRKELMPPHDVYMTPETAMSHGIIDGIVELH